MEWRKDGSGYYEIQSTKPQTIGYSLADSPVGLLSWIYEKLVTWTDGYPFTDDEGLHGPSCFNVGFADSVHSLNLYLSVLTWVSIYWFSRAGPVASCRIYYESLKANDTRDTTVPTIPKGISFFPKELVNLPRAYVTPSS